MYGLEEGSFFALAAAAAAAAASVEAGSAESKTAVSTVIFSDVSAIGKARCGGFGDVKFAIGVSGEASFSSGHSIGKKEISRQKNSGLLQEMNRVGNEEGY